MGWPAARRNARLALALALALGAAGGARGDCPCVARQDTPAAGQTDCLLYESADVEICFPLSYGFDTCAAHDLGREPFCGADVSEYPGAPDWCAEQWCYVDPNNCDVPNFRSSFFPGLELYYSYHACGGGSSFEDWAETGLDFTYTLVAAAIERYVIATKRSLEEAIPSIASYVLNNPYSPSVQQECALDDSCSCATCQPNECWQESVDIERTSDVTNADIRGNVVSAEEKLVAGCLSNSITTSYRKIARKEYRDTTAVAYQYYGDQRTGMMTQWPAIQFCPTDFDARLRPWYAAAVAGPRDIVIVIDDSGSMAGDRVKIALKAVQTVLRTLTWVDYVSVITFDADVKFVYSQSLVRATEESVADIAAWAESKLEAEGGTNFMAPLERAYQILAQSADSDGRTTCEQIVLFMTDGEAEFDEELMRSFKTKYADPVVFTYGLGTSAAAIESMACEGNGIYYPVTNEETLPRVMASYYEYFAQQQNECELAWVNYTDFSTGKQLIAACGTIYGESRALAGVTCFDLSVLVGLDVLDSCGAESFDRFETELFKFTSTCRNGLRRPSDCRLQQMRLAAGGIGCSALKLNCDEDDNGVLANGTSCSGLASASFRSISISECNYDQGCEATSPPTSTPDSLPAPVIGGVVAAVFLLACVAFFLRRRFARAKGAPPLTSLPQAPTTEPEVPIAVAASQPVAIPVKSQTQQIYS